MPFINSVRSTHGAEGRFPLGNFRATGGAITYTGAYTVHTFSYTGADQLFSTGVPTRPAATLEYLIVAGGGGAGVNGNVMGGAGAGGLITGTFTNFQPGNYTITVGAGNAPGVQGGSSVFNSLTAVGGGYGGSESQSPPPSSGGSGGGASYTGTGGAATAGQGYPGGNGGPAGNTYPCGGGGGAGQAGEYVSDGARTRGGYGGSGITNSLNGTSTYYAGGGGGAAWGGANTYSTAGAGGGGRGGYFNNGSQTSGDPGTDGLGGGGGAGSNGSLSKRGGHGVIILRYTTPS